MIEQIITQIPMSTWLLSSLFISIFPFAYILSQWLMYKLTCSIENFADSELREVGLGELLKNRQYRFPSFRAMWKRQSIVDVIFSSLIAIVLTSVILGLGSPYLRN